MAAGREASGRRSALLLAVLQYTSALPVPDVASCSSASIDFESCGVGNAGSRSMEELPNIRVPMPHWWEAMPEYKKQCDNCTDIWMLCPSEDTGGWDGGDVLRVGSMMMLETINSQQWLLPGYELRCEWYNDNCHGYTGQKIVSAKLHQNPEKYVAIGTSGCSGVCGHIARYTQHYNMPMMSWAAGMPDLTDRTVFRNFFRTRIPHTAFTYAWLQVAKICDWKTIVLVMAEEARFRGHSNLMKETIHAEPGMSVAFEAQILSPTVQTDAVVQTIKDNRYRIIQMITYETTWRAMMCSANELGASGLVWMVYGFYTTGFYGTLDDPDLSQWSCDKEVLRKMSHNAIFAKSFMWATSLDKAIDCDRDKSITTRDFMDQYLKKAGELSTNKTLSLGGRDYKTNAPRDAGAQAADGACLYALALSKLLGLAPDNLTASLNYESKNTYALSQLQGRNGEAYEDMNQLLQSAEFYGVSNSPFTFQCDNMPENRICNDTCRNSKGCTGDAKGQTILFQFDSTGTEGDSDGTSSTSEFPTVAEGPVESYTWRNALRFDYGGYWGGDVSSAPADIPYYGKDCLEGYHRVVATSFCVPDDMLPNCQAEDMVLSFGGFCEACPAGKMYQVIGAGAIVRAMCSDCPAGEFQNETGQTACTKCPKGTVPNGTGDYVTGSSTCQSCAAGRYSPAEGSQLCSFCNAGRFSQGGASACARCPVGKYTAEKGMSICTSCTEDSPELWTTLEQTRVQGQIEWIPFSGAQSSTSCACVPGDSQAEGAFMDASGQCVPCPRGMICPGPGGVEIVAGFMIQPLQQGQSLSGDIQVFRCIRESDCPGSSDLYSWKAICGTHYGIACGQCPVDHFTSGSDCEPCVGDSNIRVARILAVFVSPLLALFLYVKINRENIDESDEETRTATADRLSLLLGGRLKKANLDFIVALRDELYIIFRDTFQLLLDFVQTLGVFSAVFNTDVGPLLDFVYSIGKLLILDMSIVLQQLGSFGVPAGCMIGSDFFAIYSSSFCLPLWIGVFFGLNLTMYALVLPKVRQHASGCRLCRCVPAVRITADKTVNALGAQICAFFIGLTSMSTSLFVTYPHPGGEQSLRRYPSVLLGDANWNKALPLGIIGLLFYTVSVLAGAIWVCLRAPRFAHVKAFRVRYYFLLDGYRPQAWYWGAVLLIKALIINLIFVAFSSIQLIMMSSLVVFISLESLKFLVQPWPQHTMNIADATYSIAMCIIVPAMYIRTGLADVPVLVTYLEQIAVFAPFAVTGLCLYVSFYRFMHKSQRGVSWLRKSMRLQFILFFTSRLSLKEFNRFINGLEDYDQTVLWQAMHILYARLLKWQAGTALSQQAVIPDANCYQVVNNGEMLRKTFQVSIQERSDSHVFHEHAVLQHVYESLLRSCMGAGGHSLKSDCHKRCDQIFAMLDKDGSGVLSIQEFMMGAVASSFEVTAEEAMEAFELMDLDADGYVSRQEFAENFIGMCVDPIDPDVADERRLMLQHAFLLPSESNASAQADAATRAGRKLRIRLAAVRIQRVFRRFLISTGAPISI
jgi:Ca2+-binding EF-hand superfamily protein